MKHNCVPPSGPKNADYFFIGEAPGRDEDKKLIPFVGKTGREVNEHYLPLANLRRENVYFTNAIKCLPPSSDGRLDMGRKQDLDILDSCTVAHLFSEIEAVRPKYLIPMGAFACHALDPDIVLDLHHGIPMPSPFGGTMFPMWHPAGGIHEPKKMLQIRTDWVRLRRLGLGRLTIPKDAHPHPDYKVADRDDILCIDPNSPMAVDTESSKRLGPYCLTYSQIPGTARLIKADDPYSLNLFQKQLDSWKSTLIFHNWMYDSRIVGKMGLRFPDSAIRDTMIECFHLGNIPQALKILAYRLLGMTMQDFEDLVKPYSRAHVLEYYHLAHTIPWPKPEEQVRRIDTGLFKLYRPQGLNTKLKRFFNELEKKPEKDVFGVWDNWEEDHAMIENLLGPWPGLDIAHTEFEEMLKYACRDADATLRLSYVLEEMRLKAHSGVPQENWGV
ncbi:MAG: uracil-DNA glycosylase family protein [Nitrospiraceae bacterium]